MASTTPEQEKAAAGLIPATDDGFTYADDQVLVDGEMLGTDPDFASADPDSSQVDPDITTSKELKEQAEEEEGEKESGTKGLHNQLATTLFISGAVVAVIGAIFAVAKQIKQA